MSDGRHRHSDATLTVPNALTVLRMVLATIAAILFADSRREGVAVALCAVSAALDAFDGWYARTFVQCSRLGEHLDPLADKLLMAVVYGVIALRIGSAAVWALILLIGVREIGMTAFRSYSLRRHQKFIPANRFGKAKMIAQSVGGIGVIAAAVFGPGWGEIPLFAVVGALSAILLLSYASVVVYARDWTRALAGGGVGAMGGGGGAESGAVSGERAVGQ